MLRQNQIFSHKKVSILRNQDKAQLELRVYVASHTSQMFYVQVVSGQKRAIPAQRLKSKQLKL